MQMSKAPNRRKPGTHLSASTKQCLDSRRPLEDFDLDSILEDLEADLCKLVENVTERRADSDLQTVAPDVDETRTLRGGGVGTGAKLTFVH
jgi:hypothetical protein